MKNRRGVSAAFDLFLFVLQMLMEVFMMSYVQIVTSAEEGGYVFGAVCLSVRRITRKLVNGF